MNKIITLLIIALATSLVTCKKNNQQGGLGPTITITPTSGLAGTIVSISGKGFSTDNSMDIVTFNGTPAILQRATDSQLIVTVPNGTTGPVKVNVGNQQASGGTYTFQALSITTISPAGGPAGTVDTINGAGLNFMENAESLLPAVYFNGAVAKIIQASSTQLIAIVPARAGYGPVIVTLGNLQATGPNFGYLGLDSISPLTGNVGTTVTLTGGFGSNFANATVTFNGITAKVSSATQGKLVVTVPAGASTGTVVVTINGQTIPGPVFTFVPPPTITAISSSSGPAGFPLTLTGANFSSVPTENTVSFNGTVGKVVSASGTQLVVDVPGGGTSGKITLTVNGQSVTGPVFTYQSLGVKSVTPADFIPPATVTVTGTGFSSVAAQNTVLFNGTAVTVTSASDTQLVVSVPQTVTSGMISVQVGSLIASGLAFSTAGVVTFAGGAYGLANGVGTQAQFMAPAGVAIDGSGNVFVADMEANNIRKIAPDGTVTNFAGDPNGNAGYTDAQGAGAQFNAPNDLIFDKNGNLYVADQNNAIIRKIAPDGTVTTFAPIPNGDQPWGVAIDKMANIYASDWSGNTGFDNDYEFNPAGMLVNTLAMNDGARLTGITVDGQGNVYTIDKRGIGIFRNTALFFNDNNLLSSNANRGLCLDNSGNLIVEDGGNNLIELLNPQTMVFSVITGGGGNGSTSSGYMDGTLGVALFNNPIGAKVDAKGNIYVADQGNYAIRKISTK